MLKDEGGMLKAIASDFLIQHSAFILHPFPILAPAGR
jgi:hypothetical protein